MEGYQTAAVSKGKEESQKNHANVDGVEESSANHLRALFEWLNVQAGNEQGKHAHYCEAHIAGACGIAEKPA
jgi:low affinity Fe/Cu permease